MNKALMLFILLETIICSTAELIQWKVKWTLAFHQPAWLTSVGSPVGSMSGFPPVCGAVSALVVGGGSEQIHVGFDLSFLLQFFL